jgi:AcrR family transcriptional regulator
MSIDPHDAGEGVERADSRAAAGTGAAPTEPTHAGVRLGRTRVPAAERREALIAAAVHEFARGGLHGTAVERVARRVGVAQPYVFTLFANKRELFLAAVARGFEEVANTFRAAAREYREGLGDQDCQDVLMAMGAAYTRLLQADRDYLLLQHQAYAACGDDVVREFVRRHYAGLVELVRELSQAEEDRVDEFIRKGMALNVAAALGVEDLSVSCEWISAALEGSLR